MYCVVFLLAVWWLLRDAILPRSHSRQVELQASMVLLSFYTFNVRRERTTCQLCGVSSHPYVCTYSGMLVHTCATQNMRHHTRISPQARFGTCQTFNWTRTRMYVDISRMTHFVRKPSGVSVAVLARQDTAASWTVVLTGAEYKCKLKRLNLLALTLPR